MIVFAVALFALPVAAASKPGVAIEMTTLSWGKTVLEWRIEPDGKIVVTEMEESGFWGPGPHKLITRTAAPAPSRYKTIRTLLDPARRRANTALACKNPATDAASGTVTWGPGAKLDYYDGCYEASTGDHSATSESTAVDPDLDSQRPDHRDAYNDAGTVRDGHDP